MAERPPAAAAVVLRERQTSQRSETRCSTDEREGGRDAYAAAESGEGAAADVAVGRLLERRRRLHGLRRRLAANLMLRRSVAPRYADLSRRRLGGEVVIWESPATRGLLFSRSQMREKERGTECAGRFRAVDRWYVYGQDRTSRVFL